MSFLTYIITFQAAYRGKPHQFEVDALSATDAMNAFLLAKPNLRLAHSIHDILSIKVKDNSQPQTEKETNEKQICL